MVPCVSRVARLAYRRSEELLQLVKLRAPRGVDDADDAREDPHNLGGAWAMVHFFVPAALHQVSQRLRPSLVQRWSKPATYHLYVLFRERQTEETCGLERLNFFSRVT